MDELIAAGAPGLESVLAQEATALGLRRPRLFKPGEAADGRVALDGGRDALARANLLLRSADRVLVRLGAFAATEPEALERACARLPWERFLPPGRALNVRVRARRSRLHREDLVAERVVRGAGARRKAKIVRGKDDAAQLVEVRVFDDAFSIELDSSGAPLSRRGWRLATAKAPLKETLAAALVLASGWDRRAPLLDPFCGSGTVVVEAALLAAGWAPSRGRRYAFMDWPGFDRAAFERVRAAAPEAAASPFPRILASDRDAGAIEAARANAERAGVADKIEFSCRALSDVSAPAGAGWLVTNPPYGVRVSEGKDLRALYSRLGDVARGFGADWTVALLSPSAELARATGLSFDSALSSLNGGIPVRVLTHRPR